MSFWESLRRRLRPNAAANAADGEADTETGPHLSEYVSFGPGHAECEVLFLHPARGIRRTIVDRNGKIHGFPGFDESDPAMKSLPEKPAPRIRYRTDFTRQPDGRYMVVWEVQPDGRYWGDEGGFGMTHDVEITLYSFLDETGHFTAPFRVYNVGTRNYYHKDKTKEDGAPAG